MPTSKPTPLPWESSTILEPGDHFHFKGSPTCGHTGGKILKITPTKLTYESPYMGDMVLTLTMKKVDVLVPGRTFYLKKDEAEKAEARLAAQEEREG